MIELRSVGKIYSTAAGPVSALHGIDLTIQRGEFVAVVGPSGAGKSTFLNLIGCLDLPTSGQVIFLGADTSGLTDDQLSQLRNRAVGFLFQSCNLIADLTVRANVELPLVYAGVTRERQVLSYQLLAYLGLVDCANQPAGSISVGDQQRVAIARALITDPDLIVADEPTGSVDTDSSAHLLRTLSDLHAQGRTVVLATDNESVAQAAERVVRFNAGTTTARAKPARTSVKLARPAVTSDQELGA